MSDPITYEREWTLMFYFASDNPLAPGIVSQLKALKNAGYHHGASVIAYFDPETRGTPTHTFDVNGVAKILNPRNLPGYRPNDPYVRNLMYDKLWGDELTRNRETKIRESLMNELGIAPASFVLPKPPNYPGNELPVVAAAGQTGQKKDQDHKGHHGPEDSLKTFLSFCAEHYKANHYMLFILGHGGVVGNDVFLYDKHAETPSLKLRTLGKVLREFKEKIGNSSFELLSLHSCSMSSLEVAFELHDTANYMLASQGPAFVGSWPYTQILIRIFNDIEALTNAGAPESAADARATLIETMIEKIFKYVLYNSTDYMLAGYSFDLSLCDLRKINNGLIEKAIKDWATALKESLADSMVMNLILLAHWKAQSYWGDYYTDLYDFCFCLRKYLEQLGDATGDKEKYKVLIGHCTEVMGLLAKRSSKYPNNAIQQAEFAGPEAQYSHGFSVFFPWSAPSADKTISSEYQGDKKDAGYRFNATGWYDFLKQYWGAFPGDGTQRAVRKEETDSVAATQRAPSKREELLEDMASLMFNDRGPLNTPGALDDDPPVKPRPTDPTGDECTCGSVKNYPHDTRPLRERVHSAFEDAPPFSPGFLSL